MGRSSSKRTDSSKEIGVISDTHGLVRDEAVAALAGCEIIIHAGDIGGMHVLERLRDIAPTYAVRGNNDRQSWANGIPDRETVTVNGARIYVLHDISELDVDPQRDGYAAVIFGHSHKPLAEMRDGVLFLNPGSAGPRRFRLPIALARLTVANGALTPQLVDLAVENGQRAAFATATSRSG